MPHFPLFQLLLILFRAMPCLLCLQRHMDMEDIQPVVKRMRLPKGPYWWEQCSAERAERQHDISLPPLDWDLPAFPACTAAPCHRGMSEAGVPEVPLPTHGRRGSGGAARGGRRRPHPFLTVVAAVVFMILVPWLAFHGDRFLDF